jgi:signal transduction histidine kinase/ligand-binding sensor domain-containing protein
LRLTMVLMLIVCYQSLQSQEHRSVITDLFHTAWTADDGLPSPVKTIAQTTDGYLWIGTQSGLVRFDGIRLERFEPPEFPELPSTDIEFLLGAPEGSLWVGYHAGGITRIKGTEITNYGEADGLSGTQITGFALDEQGTLWAGTSVGLKRFANGRWSSVGLDWNLSPGTVAFPLLDRQGRIWVMQRNAVYYLARGSHSFIHREVPLNGEELRDLIPMGDGTVWAGTSQTRLGQFKRILLLSDPTPSPEGQESSALKALLSGRESEIFRELNGSLLVATPSGGIIRIPDQTFLDARMKATNVDVIQHFSERDGLSGDEVLTFFQDREGNIWTGTNLGMDRFRKKSVFRVATPIQNGSAVVEPTAGTIWSGGPDGVFSISNGTVSHLARPPNAYCMYRAVDGTVWVGGYGTLIHSDRGHLEDVALPDGISPKNPSFVRAITRDVSGAIWISVVQHGAYKLTGKGWQHYGDVDDLPKLTPVVLHASQRGGVWFGYLDGRIANFNHGKVIVLSVSNGLDLGNVTALDGNEDHVWVGGQHGLSLVRAGHVYRITTEQDNTLLNISGIVETANGDLWLYGSKGLSHLPGPEIERQLREPQHRIHADVFDRRDGVPGVPSQFSHLPSEILSTSGKIWLSGSGGVAWIDPANVYRDPSSPPVLIQRLHVDGRLLSIPSEITLPPLPSNVQIDYTSTSLSIPERIRFRYRLDGVDADWQDVGLRRQAFYTHLAPGRYTFHVSARNGDGNWSVYGAATSFSVAPAYYQTVWFEGFCAVGALALLWLLYRMRVWQIARAISALFDERLAERTRIAGDLHDTLLQDFQAVLLNFHTVGHLLPDRPVEAVDTLQSAIGDAHHAITEARNAVQGLRLSSQPAIDLDQALLLVPQELCLKHVADFRVTVQGTPQRFRPAMRDEIYLIGREAIANSFRHTEATQIEVEITYSPHAFCARICDNGGGIDPKYLQSGREGHWGILGMRERARRIGARLTFRNVPGSGLEVELHIPGRLVFESRRHRPE